MKISQYTIHFCTPAFLGNAEQNGQWRTPPFKAQLRQWWRVAYAEAAKTPFQPDVAAMRDAEGRLFGNAWLDGEFSKSRVRIRLGQWNEGKLKSWDGPDPTLKHGEVRAPVGAQLYMGFGPLISRNGTALKANAAIQAGETNAFSIAYPESEALLVERALELMCGFGTVGGRSRNGWGSYSMRPRDGGSALPASVPMRPWRDALALDWPHAIGRDEQGPLIWQTRPFADWKALMRALAAIKIGLRTQFKFPQAQPDGQIHPRHWLSYPVTRHSVRSWGNNARLPNSLRFKLRPTGDGQLVGVIFHMPCRPPSAFAPDQHAITGVWRQVHAFLDAPDRFLTRISA